LNRKGDVPRGELDAEIDKVTSEIEDLDKTITNGLHDTPDLTGGFNGNGQNSSGHDGDHVLSEEYDHTFIADENRPD
jgi:hypothetical protein